MATKDYGSISKTTPSYNPFTEDGMSNLDLERKRRSLNDARSKLQHLENMNKVIGTSSDNKEHCVTIQNNMEKLLSDSKELVGVKLSLDGGTAQMIARSQCDNPLSSQYTFGSDDSDEWTPRDVTVSSLQMEAERRELKERNRAFQALMQDVTDLNSLMKQMAVAVDTQQEGIECIETDVEEAAPKVSDGNRSLLKAVVARDFSLKRLMNGFTREVKEFTKDLKRTSEDFSQRRLMNGFIREVKEFAKDFQRTSERKRRRFISIIIGVVVGVVIVVVLVSK